MSGGRDLNMHVDRRVARVLPIRPVGVSIGVVQAVIPSTRKLQVLMDGSSQPVTMGYPALPTRPVAGDKVVVEASKGGWFQAVRVVGRDPITLQAPVIASILTPQQLVANTDDWSPAGGTAAYLWRISSDIARNITGTVAGVNGERHEWVNVGGSTITLKHDVTSALANRLYCAGSADASLTVNRAALLTYDAVSARWRVGLLS